MSSVPPADDLYGALELAWADPTQWRPDGDGPDLAALAHCQSRPRQALVELACEDLEYRFTHPESIPSGGPIGRCPRAEAYVWSYPMLARNGGPPRALIVAEYDARRRRGGLRRWLRREFAERYPVDTEALKERFDRVDRDHFRAGLRKRRRDDTPAVPNRFKFLEKEPLGSGGFGAVYAAYDKHLERKVALKVLHAVGRDIGRATMRRARREARAASALDHPGIVTIYDARWYPDAGPPWIAMRLIQGANLAEWVRRHGPLDLATTVGLVREVAAAIGEAHQHEPVIIHGDLKPQNVMIDVAGRPVVVDFGLSRLIRRGVPGCRSSGFTREYAAPEQLGGMEAGKAADVYSLGVILHELLTGRRPVAPGPSALPATGEPIPGIVAAVCLHCLAERPEERYEDAAELARALGLRWEFEPTVEDCRVVASCASYWNSTDPRRVVEVLADDASDLARAYARATPREHAGLALEKAERIHRAALGSELSLNPRYATETAVDLHHFFHDLMRQAITHSPAAFASVMLAFPPWYLGAAARVLRSILLDRVRLGGP